MIKKYYLLLLICFGCNHQSQNVVAEKIAKPVVNQVAVIQPIDLEAQRLEEINSLNKIADVINILNLKDTGNEKDPDELIFYTWSASHMTWLDLQSIAKTKFSLVMKDSDSERGKLLCFSGTVTQIFAQRRKEANNKLTFCGGIETYDDVVRFHVVGSSGHIVAGNYAKVCGIVTGKYFYDNTGGGKTESVMIVGMFDLPENKVK